MSLEAPALVPRPSLQRLFLTGLLTLLPIWLTWVAGWKMASWNAWAVTTIR